jgi:hypothetical protein
MLLFQELLALATSGPEADLALIFRLPSCPQVPARCWRAPGGLLQGIFQHQIDLKCLCSKRKQLLNKEQKPLKF